MSWKASWLRPVWSGVLLMFFLGGCAVHPKIATEKLKAKSTVAIVETPPLKNVALIGVITPYFDFHFSSGSDHFFSDPGYKLQSDYASGALNTALNQQSVTPRTSIGASATSVATAGLVGALIQASAEDTQQKAMGFDAEVRKLFPGIDLQKEFLDALVPALKQRGMQPVVLAGDKTNTLRWPAKNEKGESYRSGSLSSSESIDSDLVLQVSPIAFWNAPGPLNAYRMNVSVGVAVYDGRTKEFLGRQTIVYGGPSGGAYSTYSGLLSDLNSAIPALRGALISLAPKAADLVSGHSVD
jgi:hypothetical protein